MRALQESASESKYQEQAWAFRVTVVLLSLWSANTQPPSGLAGTATVLGQQLLRFLTPSVRAAGQKGQMQRRQTESGSLEAVGHTQQVLLWTVLSLLYQLSQPVKYLQSESLWIRLCICAFLVWVCGNKMAQLVAK